MSRNTQRPKKRSLGKTKPLAIDVFAEKAKQDKIEAEKKLTGLSGDTKGLKKEVVDSKRSSNQNHFAFVSAIIGGAVAGNFIGLRGDGFEEHLARVVMIIGVGGLARSVNNHYAVREEIFNHMIDEVNDLIEQLKAGKTPNEIPHYKQLYDQVKEEIAGTKDQEKAIKKKFNNRVANGAVDLIVGAALSLYVYKGVDSLYENRESISTVIREILPTEDLDQRVPKLDSPERSPN